MWEYWFFDEVEELDFVGPFEVFGQASRLVGGVEVAIVAKQFRRVRCRYGLQVQPDHDFSNCPLLDLLVVPGGKGAEHVRHDRETLSFIRENASRGLVASVCTGALILAEAGLLKGHKATTHWSALEELRRYPNVDVQEHVRFVREGRVATSAGISAGIDLALSIVAETFGVEAGRNVAHHMEYQYFDAT